MNTHLGDSFCFWDAQTQLDTCIMILDTCVTTILLYSVIRTFLRAKKVLNPGVLKFYHLMILWGILFIGRDIFGILVFFIEYWQNREDLSGSDGDKKKMHELITQNSKIYQLVDSFPGLIIQTLLLLIPLQILGNMLTFNLMQDEEAKKLHRVGKVYKWIRLVMMVPSFVLFFPLEVQVLAILNQVKSGLFIIDGFVCLYFLMFVLWKGTEYYQPLNAQSDFIEPLKKQLCLLIIVAMLRVGIKIIVYFIAPNYSFKAFQENCFYEKGFYDGDVYFTISYIILADYFMHFLPIFIIRRMYQPPSK